MLLCGMRLVNCQHPRIVVNLATGEKIRVRCGRCATCCNARAKDWINRLIEESQHHKFAFMVNLTYDNEHLPRLVYNDDTDELVLDKDNTIRIPFHEITDLIDKQKSDVKEKEYALLKARLNHPLSIPCHCTRDIQLFNKRLNKYIHDNITHSYANFRYFVCSEYGPTTHRIHYHAIYWFEDSVLASRFNEVVFACWKNGNSSVAHIFSTGGYSYVAQYVNMLTHLPSFYAHKDIKQRHIFSKCPSIGSPKLLDSEIRDVYDRKPTRRTFWNSKASRFDVIPVNGSFKARFFPVIEGYNRRSDFDRITLYRAVEFLPSSCYEEFANAMYSVFSGYDTFGLSASKIRFFQNYCRELGFNSKQPDSVDSRLYKLYLVSNRFWFLHVSLNCSPEWLYKNIVEYHKKCDYERLKDFYQFQADYCKTQPASDLVSMYPDVYDLLVNDTDKKYLDSPKFQAILATFGTTSLTKYEDSYDYKTMVSQHDSIYKDSHKRHEINSYAHSEKFRELDPGLQKIILNYLD